MFKPRDRAIKSQAEPKHRFLGLMPLHGISLQLGLTDKPLSLVVPGGLHQDWGHLVQGAVQTQIQAWSRP